ncbi:PREDICTED: histamine H3 receptor-like [Branchiostoma belcheri]|uniref:Histamine H3 receptor-like n=1 Tax=Branchiostoma belcheri TaxID=7741 RepID=A0A6P5AXD9_BRABE|nr:PREDICTED: histamine H3 receptor-like [Branchiostoma belcheri]
MASAGTIVLNTFFSCLSAVTIIGNVLAIAVFTKDGKLRSTGDVYILNLAVADLTVGAISMPFTIAENVIGHWPLSQALCKAWLVVDFTACSESVLSMVLISFDRYLQIVRPHRHRAKTFRVKLALLACTWIIAFLMYGPAILLWDVFTGVNPIQTNRCEADFPLRSAAYTFTMSFMEFVVPLALLSYLYSQVYCHAIRWFRRRPSSADGRGTATELGKMFHRRLAVNLTVLLLVFFVCWCPYMVGTMILSQCASCIDYYSVAFVALDWLLWSNSAINPFLYAYCSPRFRESVTRLVSKCCGTQTAGHISPQPV